MAQNPGWLLELEAPGQSPSPSRSPRSGRRGERQWRPHWVATLGAPSCSSELLVARAEGRGLV